MFSTAATGTNKPGILFYRIMTNSISPHTALYTFNREPTDDVHQTDPPRLAASANKGHKEGLDVGAENEEIWRCDLQNWVRKTFKITALPTE